MYVDVRTSPQNAKQSQFFSHKKIVGLKISWITEILKLPSLGRRKLWKSTKKIKNPYFFQIFFQQKFMGLQIS